MADEMKPAYLFHGTDTARIDETRSRLRRRAESGGSVASLEVFEAVDGRGTPDADQLADSISTMSLIPTRRFLLADGIQKWGSRQQKVVTEALISAPGLTTVVLISRGKVPGSLEDVVKKVGGETKKFDAPPLEKIPSRLVEMALAKRFDLEIDAARLLTARWTVGSEPEDAPSMARLENELNRLALWAGPDGRVGVDDIEEMVADDSGLSKFALGEAIVEGDRVRVLRTAHKLTAQGETIGGLVYLTASTLRQAERAMSLMEAGVPPNQITRQLRMRPDHARKLVGMLRSTSLETLKDATVAISDLEVWTRGGAEYPDELALDLALMAATDDGL